MTLDTSQVDELIASALRISVVVLHEGQGYLDTPGWDSFGHVEVMLAIEAFLGTSIDDDRSRSLRSRAAIYEYVLGHQEGGNPSELKGQPNHQAENDAPAIARGLSGVVFATTSICDIQGKAGRLSYRGIDIETLAARGSFDDVCILLMEGALPEEAGRDRFRQQLREKAVLSSKARERAAALAGISPTHALIALVVLLSEEADLKGFAGDDAIKELGVILLAKLPIALAIVLNPGLVHAEFEFDHRGIVGNLLTHLQVLGGNRDDETIRFVETIFLLQAEHSSNASSFAARVATSTCATAGMALAAAIAAFSGTLHGGAIYHVVRQVEEIGTPSRVQQELRDRRARGEPIYGFGHRVYRVTDPRARVMERVIQELVRLGYDQKPYSILCEMRKEMATYSRQGIAPNVDLYAGTIYRMLNVSDHLLLALFCVARFPGWIAHIREQNENNVLIRPEMKYVPSELNLSRLTRG